MIKRFLLTTILGAAILTGRAETETFTFSYVSEPCNLGAIGYNSMAQTYGAAIKLQNTDYVGMRIVKVDAYINADQSTLQNISNTSVFLSANLANTTPTIASANVTPSVTTFSRETVGLLSYSPEEPYVITPDPVYVGYYLTVDRVPATNNDGERYPILIDKNVKGNPDAFYYYDRNSVDGMWSDINSDSGAAVIVLTLEREAQEYNLVLGSSNEMYALPGKSFALNMGAINNGLQPFSSVSYTLSYGDGEPMSGTVELDAPIAPDVSVAVPLPLTATAPEDMGDYKCTLTITALDGHALSGPGHTVSFTLKVVPLIPKHRPLVEEFTNIQCGFCPRGYVAMEYISETYPDDAVVICYHNNAQGYDPMTVTNTMPLPSSGNPNSCIDRVGTIDPYYGSPVNGIYEDMGILNDLLNAMESTPIADIEVEVLYDPAIKTVKATSTSTFIQDVNNDMYRVGYVLSCNNMTDPNWGQLNYFSHDTAYENAPLLSACVKWMPTQYGLVFNDIAINVVAYKGVSNSLINVKAGVPVENTFTFDISDVKNVINRSLNDYISPENLVVNAFIIQRTNGQIVNACKAKISGQYDAVDTIVADDEVTATEYFDLSGRKVVNPDKGIYIKSERLSNGKIRTTKVVI